ncbi:hypothetical protein ACE1TF_05010 [Geomicrobium sp. JSM 1781026]|uniref:hypothetical protein n=1 Tax=Geomicrobium sp. JSM 1781026 TaxID=3344580 RepID=UPI0035C0FFAF
MPRKCKGGFIEPVAAGDAGKTNDRSALEFSLSVLQFAHFNEISAVFSKLDRSLSQLERRFQAPVPTTCRPQRGRHKTELGSARLAPTSCGYFGAGIVHVTR